MTYETWCDELSAAAGVHLRWAQDGMHLEMASPCGDRIAGGSFTAGWRSVMARRESGLRTITFTVLGDGIDPRALGHALRAWIDTGDVLPLCALWIGGEP